MTLRQAALRIRKNRMREMGDHRRWTWMSAGTWIEDGCEVHWDAYWGRLYSPLHGKLKGVPLPVARELRLDEVRNGGRE